MSNPADAITLAISKLTIDAQSYSSSPSVSAPHIPTLTSPPSHPHPHIPTLTSHPKTDPLQRPSQEVLNLLTEGHHALLSYIGELHSCFADCRYCTTDTAARDVDVVVPEMIAFCHRYFEDCGDGCPFGGDCVDCQEGGGAGEGSGEEERGVDVMVEGEGEMQMEGEPEAMSGAQDEDEDEDMRKPEHSGWGEVIGVEDMPMQESGKAVGDDEGEMHML
ncbi:Oligosaccharide translocation protein rft1 [Elsinoe australis]|uniref:Oligosaccharide translocation protein rft1 n=1 Tax=Elsinoe australis TaxID=40998 RepID=A0A2P7Z3Z1_9PEZI|nr:Oligosaccharide translocation protein rft1 [Elsinoe australis]